MIRKTFRTNQKLPPRASRAPPAAIGMLIGIGLCQPPRKSVVATAATLIMFAYSAMKNMANFMLLYSVW